MRASFDAGSRAARPPLVQYWHESRHPPGIAELLRSFRDHNDRLEQHVFDEASARKFISDRYGPRELEAFDACAIPAMQADYFRYCVMLALGGIYADADLRCHGAIDGLLEGPEDGRLVAKLDALMIQGRPSAHVFNGLFAFRRPGHPFLALALDLATAGIERRVAESVWVTTGPGVFSAICLIGELGSLESFRELSAGQPAVADLVCEVAGDFSRIAEALAGVRVSSVEATTLPVSRRAEVPLPHKAADTHWLNAQSSIFR
jgi:mannosyltransferase OCH1-like enzyme